MTMTPSASAQPCTSLQVRNPSGNYIVPGVQRGHPLRPASLRSTRTCSVAPARRPSVVVIHGGGPGRPAAASRTSDSSSKSLTQAGLQLVLGRLSARRSWQRFEDSLADLRSGARRSFAVRRRDFGIDRQPAGAARRGLRGAPGCAARQPSARPACIGAVLIGGLLRPRSRPRSLTAGHRRAAARARISDRTHHVRSCRRSSSFTEARTARSRSIRRAATARPSSRPADAAGWSEVAGASHRSENWWPTQWSYKREVTSAGSRTVAPVPAEAHRPHAVRASLHEGHSSTVESPRLRLDAFVPRTRQADPGGHRRARRRVGSWRQGDLCHAALRAAGASRAGVVLDRLSPDAGRRRIEEQLEDLRQAIRFVRASTRSLQHRSHAHRLDR